MPKTTTTVTVPIHSLKITQAMANVESLHVLNCPLKRVLLGATVLIVGNDARAVMVVLIIRVGYRNDTYGRAGRVVKRNSLMLAMATASVGTVMMIASRGRGGNFQLAATATALSAAFAKVGHARRRRKTGA